MCFCFNRMLGYVLFFVIAISVQCYANTLQVTTQQPLDQQVASASGIVYYQKHYYVVNDNSPYLFVLDKHFKVIKKIRVHNADLSGDGTVPGSKKADIESIALAHYQTQDYLIMLGSGSGKNRYKGYRLNLSNDQITAFDLLPLYQKMTQQANFPKDTSINIEGIAIGDEKVYVANRGNSHKNILYIFDRHELLAYFFDDTSDLPGFEFYFLDLPVIGQHQSTFSDLAFDSKTHRLVLTASVEVDSNALEDGMILGSFVGIVPINDLKNQESLVQFSDVVATAKQGVLQTKVEGVAIIKNTKNMYEVVAVSDNDGGVSQVFTFSVHWSKAE